MYIEPNILQNLVDYILFDLQFLLYNVKFTPMKKGGGKSFSHAEGGGDGWVQKMSTL